MKPCFLSPEEQRFGLSCPVFPEPVAREFAFLTRTGPITPDEGGGMLEFDGPGMLSPNIYAGKGGIGLFKPGVYLALFSLTAPEEGVSLSLRLEGRPVPGAAVTAAAPWAEGSLIGTAIVTVKAGELLSLWCDGCAAGAEGGVSATLSVVEI